MFHNTKPGQQCILQHYTSITVCFLTLYHLNSVLYNSLPARHCTAHHWYELQCCTSDDYLLFVQTQRTEGLRPGAAGRGERTSNPCKSPNRPAKYSQQILWIPLTTRKLDGVAPLVAYPVFFHESHFFVLLAVQWECFWLLCPSNPDYLRIQLTQ